MSELRKRSAWLVVVGMLVGQPVYNPDVAYGSRSVQLGFRLAF
jgi:hypothetical protein